VSFCIVLSPSGKVHTVRGWQSKRRGKKGLADGAAGLSCRLSTYPLPNCLTISLRAAAASCSLLLLSHELEIVKAGREEVGRPLALQYETELDRSHSHCSLLFRCVALAHLHLCCPRTVTGGTQLRRIHGLASRGTPGLNRDVASSVAATGIERRELCKRGRTGPDGAAAVTARVVEQNLEQPTHQLRLSPSNGSCGGHALCRRLI